MSRKSEIKKILQYCAAVLFLVVAVLSIILLIVHFISISSSRNFIDLTPKTEFKNKAYISGAVVNPGVYEIDDYCLIIDLVEIAGGFNTYVDKTYINKNINLSKRVYNEDHIFVPLEGADETITTSSTSLQSDTLININTASSTELEELPGVGPSTAAKIIDGRPYTKIEDLKDINGIGDATFAKLENLICV